ncbi:hypothetical protein AVEN_218972-1 [Araneus ventricosus]|uniref:Uncharacterized protein n=1 Tax=Araneus ventricosus TaxID=182803 RepID=A0A4Y2CBS5_ARAVE|nr:hypothetical protein AVEN_218972-1 [Araneus ventricosus]
MNAAPLLVETNSDVIFLPSTCLPLYRANRRVLFPYAFTDHPESILYCIWYIKSILSNFPESEQRSAPISLDSRDSTVLGMEHELPERGTLYIGIGNGISVARDRCFQHGRPNSTTLHISHVCRFGAS